jgi:hypothetical protein
MKFSSLDLDWALTALLGTLVIVLAMVLGYSTGQSNGKITEKIAVACLDNGGQWDNEKGCSR